MAGVIACRAALIGLLGLLAAALPAAAQKYPSRPVQLVIAFPPGGVGDLVARTVADQMAGVLGQSVTVENRAGGTGAVGTRSVARSAPDGYTLLVGQTTEIVVNRTLAGSLGYDPDRELAPVALLGVMPLALAVRADAPYNSVDDLIKAARGSSRGLLVGSGGPGTPGSLAAELLRARTKTRLNHVPFEGGGAALEALLNGRVDFYFPVLLTAMPQIQSGQLKALAVSTPTRSPALPNAPTLAEAGVQGIDVTHWVGLFAPAATPREVVTLLNQATNEVLGQPGVKDRLVKGGADVRALSPEQFAEFVRVETDRYALLIRDEFCSRLWYGGCGGFPIE